MATKYDPLGLIDELRSLQSNIADMALCSELKESVRTMMGVMASQHIEIKAFEGALQEIEHLTEGTDVGLQVADIIEKHITG